MASAASPSRKRKSSPSDLDSGSSSRKKSKDSDKDTSKESRQSKRTKPKSKKDIKAGLKTVSELAKLVTSGAVQIPKSLVHYASDKALLLDQVFTILSPNDVNGMLPDILKGLKIKRIKNLCYEQLKGMTVEEITRALQREETTPCPMDVPTSDVTSSAVNQMQLAPTVNKTKDINKKASEEKVGQITEVLSGECHKEESNKLNVDPCIESKEVLKSPPDTTRQSKDEILLHVSDINDEEEAERDRKWAEKTREVQREKRRKRSNDSSNEPTVLKEEDIVTSLRVATCKKQSADRECSISKNLEMELETTDTTSKDDVMSDDEIIDVVGDVDTHEDLAFDEAESESSNEGSDLDVEVSELDAAKLLEMEMRRRALESEVKKFTQNTNQTTKLQNQRSLDNDCLVSKDKEEDYSELHVSQSETLNSQSPRLSYSRKQKTVPSKQHENSRDGGVNEVKMETDTMDIGQLLEMKLRQKALQSLLNKKKQKSTQ